MLYLQMAKMQYQAEKEFFHLLQEVQKMSLYETRKQMQDTKIEIGVIVCEDSCPACVELSRMKYTIEEAIEQMPLPVKGCTTEGGWCRCEYSVRVIR